MSILRIPTGYHSVTSNKECWVCHKSMNKCKYVIAHDSPEPSCYTRIFKALQKTAQNGDCHSAAHINCMQQIADQHKKCTVCQVPLTPFTIPVAKTLGERIGAVFVASVGAVAGLSNAELLTSKDIVVGIIMRQLSGSSIGSMSRPGVLIGVVAGEEALERFIIGYGIGILSKCMPKGRIALGGTLASATVISWGGGPISAIALGILTGAALEESEGLLSHISTRFAELINETPSLDDLPDF